jgi:hypothetical protein
MLTVVRLCDFVERLINEYGAVDGVRTGGKNESTEKTCPSAILPTADPTKHAILLY